MSGRVELGAETAGDRYYGAPQEPAEEGLDLRGLLAFFRRRRGLILGVALVGTLAAGYWGFSRKPV